MKDAQSARARMRSLDAGTASASRWRALRRFAIFTVLMAVVIETQGLPALRWNYVRQGQCVVSAEYLCPLGLVPRYASAFASGTCPLVTMLPLERSLLDYAGDLLAELEVS